MKEQGRNDPRSDVVTQVERGVVSTVGERGEEKVKAHGLAGTHEYINIQIQ